MHILIHSSKTMRPAPNAPLAYQQPKLLKKAFILASALKDQSVDSIQHAMKLSTPMANKTMSLVSDWTDTPSQQRPAIDAFLGDIYSGLQVQKFSEDDRQYANNHLTILSGLYGGLSALDSIYPYRLEMGYKFSRPPLDNLYRYWGDSIAATLNGPKLVINLAAAEYTKAILPFLQDATIISPRFLTMKMPTSEPVFVVVHAKIARGAFANWLITNRVKKLEDITAFRELGYEYDSRLSTPTEPTFVCSDFGGIGLSVRLT